MRGYTAAPIRGDTTLPALTGLRFLAALAVLISHFNHRGLISVPAGVIEFLDGGRTAVALFFVLSGFILAYNYPGLSGSAERTRFYASRIARIYPVTLLALGLGAIGVSYAATHPDSGRLLDWYSLEEASPFALGTSFLAQATMTTAWFPVAAVTQPWNGSAWSIGCEVLFYALFPLLIVKLRKLRFKHIAYILIGAWIFQMLAIRAAISFAPAEQVGLLVYQFPVLHLFEFLVGIAAAIVFLRGGREWLSRGSRRRLVLAAALVPLTLLSLFQPVAPAYVLMGPLFAVLILGLAVNPAGRRSFLARRPMILLGEASFALYMIHAPLMMIFMIADPPEGAGWLLMAGTVGLSIAVFRWFETPARHWTRAAVLRMVPSGWGRDRPAVNLLVPGKPSGPVNTVED
ncbi:acyltransferase [Arthrobacter sp. PAMC25564]|uniref:acyltransferase family protein n=1 Tax=Arthrobacter sp. PAMC25564 TaxID=2565366 RepID=UPI0010A23799|nr:acyltransferase [Arthrobacter sp. PAMC25564]QCB96569.1 acyltransferase [Arthrobacter sp. PAMC25564]